MTRVLYTDGGLDVAEDRSGRQAGPSSRSENVPRIAPGRGVVDPEGAPLAGAIAGNAGGSGRPELGGDVGNGARVRGRGMQDGA